MHCLLKALKSVPLVNSLPDAAGNKNKNRK